MIDFLISFGGMKKSVCNGAAECATICRNSEIGRPRNDLVPVARKCAQFRTEKIDQKLSVFLAMMFECKKSIKIMINTNFQLVLYYGRADDSAARCICQFEKLIQKCSRI